MVSDDSMATPRSSPTRKASSRGSCSASVLGPNLGPFLQMLGSGHTVDQALSTVNVQPEPFYAEWRRRIGMK